MEAGTMAIKASKPQVHLHVDTFQFVNVMHHCV